LFAVITIKKSHLEKDGPDKPPEKKILTATHAVATIQTLVASAAANGDVAAGIAGWCIALHIF
jgi:hypothetical protein